MAKSVFGAIEFVLNIIKMKGTEIIIISNIESDLSLIKFPNVEIVDLNNFPFSKDGQSESIKKNIEYEFLFDKSKRFVIKTDDKYPMHSIHKTFSFLKVLFPSSLKIEYFVDGIYNENNFVTTYYHNTDLNDSSKEDYLHFDELKIPLINDFIVNTFSDFYKIGYIENSIKNYIGSFDASHKHFRFLSLCICLECLINETSELLYRISRGCSIICGEDKEKANLIFFNIKKIYNLRSKIVHGSDFDWEKLDNYLVYLECLVSKIIVELLIHKIDNSKTINTMLTELGFGQKYQLSDNWYEFKFNYKVENKIIEILK